MSRLINPPEFSEKKKLFKSVLAKDTADGVASVIRIFLSEEGIVLADDDTDCDAADALNTEMEKLAKDAERDYKERDRIFDPIFKNHTDSVQFLKQLYISNPNKLGDWFVTVDGGNRVVYPPAFAERYLCVRKFIEKHNTYPGITSPLHQFLIENKIDLAVNYTDASTANDKNTAASTANTNKETKRGDRDVLCDPVFAHTSAIGQFLVKHYMSNPNKAGDWGFRVDSSPQAVKFRIIEIAPGASEMLKNVDVGGECTSMGPADAEITSGSSTPGTPIPLPSGQKFKVIRNYGTMKVKNLSGTAILKIEVPFHS